MTRHIQADNITIIIFISSDLSQLWLKYIPNRIYFVEEAKVKHIFNKLPSKQKYTIIVQKL